MTQNGTVSIVIPCFNQGQWLKDALTSIEENRNPNLHEVIIVNDGSTDPLTCQIFNELRESNYIIHHQHNLGLATARNNGIRLSTGDFILPLDGDNRINGHYLKEGVEKLLGNTNLGVVYGNAEYFGERTGEWLVDDFDIKQLSMGNYIDACALIRRSAWESVNGYDESMPFMGWEDWDLWLRLANKGWGFFHINQIAFGYRVRSGSMIEGTNKNLNALLDYIFKKPELRTLSILRDTAIELQYISGELEKTLSSKEYRMGRLLLRPLRKAKSFLNLYRLR